MKSTKFTAILTVLALLAALLSGCGATAEQGNTQQTAAEQTEPQQSAAETPQPTAAQAAAEQTSSEQTASEDAPADYADTLFDSSYVHTVDVTISEADWADLRENPLDKTKYQVSVTIDGETVDDVSFATKGNTSLTAVASDEDSDRYSFKLNFGKFVKGQTYHGLNKLNLNNIYADATYMKDYLSYELFRQAGVDAPLTSYVWLTINGEALGLYLAIEEVGKSWLERTNDGEGALYKPETEMLANMGEAPGGDGQMPDMGDFPGGGDGQMPQMPGGDGQFPGFSGGDGQMPDMGNFPSGMGFGSDSKGADLAYTDDELSSYSDIFDNNETGADEDSNRRVIAALKTLSVGGDLEQALDTDEIIRYFAAHNFTLNYDSYTGTMLHNYYLLEDDGKLSMLPWDYNLAFGGFSGSDATALVNTGIDTPLSGTTEDARPMWAWIAASETYLEQYHSVMGELISGYFESGEFERQIDALYELLLPYVEHDPSAFYTAEEFTTAYQTLRQFCLLRAQSIRAQLDGALSTQTDAQAAEDRIDASALNVRDMGSQNRGNDVGGPQRPGR